jgi:hypothetical protein
MIATRPKSKVLKSTDSKAEKFIRSASNGAAAEDGHELQTITVNVPKSTLARIDKAMRPAGFNNRTAFIIAAAVEKLRGLEG